jgi:hypothetical protein
MSTTRARLTKRDKLTRQGLDIRVYCEAAGMMPQLERVCEPYSIPVYSCSGFDSLSGKYELKESCWRAFTYKGRRTVILHLGDHDPSLSIYSLGLALGAFVSGPNGLPLRVWERTVQTDQAPTWTD